MQRTQKDLNKTAWIHPDAIDADRKRWIVDAEGKTLGRLAVEIAKKLTGKAKPYACDFWDCGDYVVVINTDKLHISGRKQITKTYYRHTGWKGHLKEMTFEKLMQKDSRQAMMLAVKGMVPKNKMRKPRLKRLKLFTGAEHKYSAMDLHTLNA